MKKEIKEVPVAVIEYLDAVEGKRKNGGEIEDEVLVIGLGLYINCCQNVKKYIIECKGVEIYTHLKVIYMLLKEMREHEDGYRKMMRGFVGEDFTSVVKFMDIHPFEIGPKLFNKVERTFTNPGHGKEAYIRLMFYIWLGFSYTASIERLYEMYIDNDERVSMAIEAELRAFKTDETEYRHILNRLELPSTSLDLTKYIEPRFYSMFKRELYKPRK